MILKELSELYDRLLQQGVRLPQLGYSSQKVSYRVIIRPDGSLVRIEDGREVEISYRETKKGIVESSRMVMREYLVPGSSKPSGSGANPCFLWDNLAYQLGCVEVKERAREYFIASKEAHLAVEDEINSSAYSAVCRFYEKWNPDNCADYLPNKEIYTGNGIFYIEGEDTPVHEDEIVKRWWESKGCIAWRKGEKAQDCLVTGMCLVRGTYGKVAVLHDPPIKGVVNSQAMGAKLVSFNCKSFESYGKTQSENSPVSEEVAFAYCNALNYLLSRKQSRCKIGDATAVFWTDAPQEKSDEIELLIGGFFDSLPEAQDKALVERVRNNIATIAKGRVPDDLLHTELKFYILGLSPNVARLSVRFFKDGSLDELMLNLKDHYDNMCLQRRNEKFHDPEVITPYFILKETARDADGIPPFFSGALMRAILFKHSYPDSIAVAILQRIKVDKDVNYVRCAYLKAWLSRKLSNYQINQMLDNNNNQPGYVMGRLFALLQKTQTDAHPSLNRTIQDAYYSSASTSPGIVFPRLLKLFRHHVVKLPHEGMKIMREKQIQSILSILSSYPSRLGLEQQGLFALGFYHQMQDLYTSQSINEQ